MVGASSRAQQRHQHQTQSSSAAPAVVSSRQPAEVERDERTPACRHCLLVARACGRCTEERCTGVWTQLGRAVVALDNLAYPTRFRGPVKLVKLTVPSVGGGSGVAG